MEALVDFVVSLAVTLGLMSSPSITLNPTQPVAGQQLQICYDFAGTEAASVTLRVEFDLLGTEEQDVRTYTVTPGDNCVTVSVPSDALFVRVSDQTLNATDATASVSGSTESDG